jgi:hypothetical protein
MLGPLDAPSVALLCRQVLGVDADATVRELAARAEGNPFLLETTLRSMRSAGRITVAGGAASADGTALPTDLAAATRTLMMHGLDAATGDLLEAGAVFGRPFSIAEAEAVRATTPNAFLGPAIQALSAGVLRAEGPRLAFAHDLLREAVYRSLPEPILAALHARAAMVVAAAGGSPVEVAEHHLRSGPDGTRPAVQRCGRRPPSWTGRSRRRCERSRRPVPPTAWRGCVRTTTPPEPRMTGGWSVVSVMIWNSPTGAGNPCSRTGCTAGRRGSTKLFSMTGALAELAHHRHGSDHTLLTSVIRRLIQ